MWILVLYLVLLVCGIVSLVFPKRQIAAPISLPPASFSFPACNCNQVLAKICGEPQLSPHSLIVVNRYTKHCPTCLERLPLPSVYDTIAFALGWLGSHEESYLTYLEKLEHRIPFALAHRLYCDPLLDRILHFLIEDARFIRLKMAEKFWFRNELLCEIMRTDVAGVVHEYMT
jgi:hypothetical protein